jgi:hypothetical protein
MFLTLLLSVSFALNPQTKSPDAATPTTKTTADNSPAAATAKSDPARAASAARPTGTSESLQSPVPVGEKLSPQPATSLAGSKKRFPRFFSQLDLDQTQQQKVHEIQGKFAAQIAQLRQQIAQLQAEREEQLDSVLKPAQKRLLKQLRTEKDAPEQ